LSKPFLNNFKWASKFQKLKYLGFKRTSPHKRLRKMGKQTSVKAAMTKDLLMKYTLIALVIIAASSYVAFGFASIAISLISVLVAVVCDYLLSLIMGNKGPRNTLSAAVFGMIVAMSYSLGLPTLMATEEISTLAGGYEQYLYPALISAIGLIVFKKIQGLAGRKYVNPAAISKLLILGLLFLPAISSFFPADHALTVDLQNVPVEGPFGTLEPLDTINFGATLIASYSGSTNASNLYTYGSATNPLPDVLYYMLVAKYHGWVGGFSSILVMVVGIALFAICRRYIKWRITLAYLVITALMATITGFVYGGDPIMRIVFHLFIGSSIFLAFFMATDPATTPITHLGQWIFGTGLAVLTVLIQTYTNFLGGSILALVIMNLTSPILDNVGIRRRPKRGVAEPSIPKEKVFASTKTVDCMRCGACMTVCPNGLSLILIKQAREKQNAKKLMNMFAEYCMGCQHCNYVCPARIDLESFTLGYPVTEDEATKIEQQYLKGTPDENIGLSTKIFSAKTSIEGQDGGVASSLLVSGMEKGLFDAAIVVQRIDGYWAEAIIAENADEILKAKGTKYMRVSMMEKLGELVAKGKRKIAIVGTACQVRAARRLQQMLLRDFPSLELTILGLFCYEEFNYAKLKAATMNLLGVDLDRAEKTQIHKGKYIVQVDGEEKSVSVKKLNEAVEDRCIHCPDFTAKYSDISIGSVGSDEGKSTVIVRSDVGEKLLETLDLTKGKVNKEEVTKLAIRKRERAEQNMQK
jgi:coenzyme F420-reducing hydrogenase beta subunit/Na+-translocating ferredoxin:NAD+ oxidoreductase RnfD subunit